MERRFYTLQGLLLAGFLLFVALLPVAAFAQANQDGANDVPPAKSGPSTGTLVAAALETAGYVGQAQILDSLGPMLTKLGALIYLVSIISALVVVATLGQYGVALWLLLGPPLFFFLIKPTESAAGVEWNLGAFHDQGDLQKALRGANVQQQDGKKVSWFFHSYNVVISDTIQQLVKLVTNNSVRQQMLFMARQSVLDDLFSAEIDSPDLLQLAHFTLAACHDEMDAARLIGLGQRHKEFKNSPEYQTAVARYCELYEQPDKNFPGGPAKTFVRALENIPPDSAAQNLDKVSCEQLWKWLHTGVQKVAKDAEALAEKNYVNHQAPEDIKIQINKDIEEKMTRINNRNDKAPPSDFKCPNGANVASPSGNELIPMIFAGWLIRKAYQNDPRGGMIQQLYTHAGIQTATLNNENYFSNWRSRSQEVTRRFRTDQLAEASRYEAFTVAKTLPYVQGAGLYCLAVMFPFFALIALVPGKAGGFFMWCALWAWFKSWDLGWALVMVADELLWSIMPHSSFFRLGPDGTPGAFNDPVTVLEAAFGGDYAYNLSTYYMLVALMITAVPVLSAHAVLGSKKAIAGIFMDGLKTLGQNLGRVAGDWVAAEQLGHIDRAREMSAFRQGAAIAKARHTSAMQERAAHGTATGAAMRSFAHHMGIARNAWGAQMSGEFNDALPPASGGEEGSAGGGGSAAGGAAGGAKGGGNTIKPQPSIGSSNSVLNSAGAAAKSALNWGFHGGKLPAGTGVPENQLPKDFQLSAGANPKLLDPSMKDYGEATVELEAHRRQIAVLNGMADKLIGAAEPLMIGGAATAIATKNFAGLGITGVGLGVAANAAGVRMQRQASQMSVDSIKAASTYEYYQATKSDQYYYYESIRAGSAGHFGRVEHWGIFSSPHEQMLQIDRKRAHAEMMSTKYFSQFFGSVPHAVIEGTVGKKTP